MALSSEKRKVFLSRSVALFVCSLVLLLEKTVGSEKGSLPSSLAVLA